MDADTAAEALERLRTLRAANDDALAALRAVGDEPHRLAGHQVEFAGKHIASAIAALAVTP
jgi:hypothetical protein